MISRGLTYWQQIGSAKFTDRRICPFWGDEPTALSLPVDFIYAIPYPIQPRRRITKLTARVTTGAGGGGVARMGIYEMTSADNPYPGALVADTGEFTTTGTGVKDLDVDVTIHVNTLIWLVWHPGVSAATILSGTPAKGMSTNLGYPTTGGDDPGMGLKVAKAYAALPATFPASATVEATASTVHVPFIAMKIGAPL